MKKMLAVPLVLLLAGVVLLAQGTIRLPEQNKQTKQEKQTKQDKGTIFGAKDDKAKTADEKALLESLHGFLETFNRGDADALAKYFGEKAELVDDEGDVVLGRDAIRKEYADAFAKNPGMRLEVAVEWFRWVSGDVVLQHGNGKLTYKDGSIVYTQYTAAHVKKDGKWLIAMVREIPVGGDDGSIQETNLRALEWLVGDWIDSDDSGNINATVAWSRNNTFLTRTYSVVTKNGVELEGTEVIGWDQSRGILRSWIFDSTGGIGEGVWLRKGDHWYCKLYFSLPDGKKASAVHIYTPRSATSYSFQAVGREVDGEVQPDLDEVVVRRVLTSNND